MRCIGITWDFLYLFDGLRGNPARNLRDIILYPLVTSGGHAFIEGIP